jgi:hypothetical protein
LDRLTTNRRIRESAYEMISISRIAADQVPVFIKEFKHYLKADDGGRENFSPNALSGLVRIEDELLVSADTYKVFTIPAGTAFD